MNHMSNYQQQLKKKNVKAQSSSIRVTKKKKKFKLYIDGFINQTWEEEHNKKRHMYMKSLKWKAMQDWNWTPYGNESQQNSRKC